MAVQMNHSRFGFFLIFFPKLIFLLIKSNLFYFLRALWSVLPSFFQFKDCTAVKSVYIYLHYIHIYSSVCLFNICCKFDIYNNNSAVEGGKKLLW